MCVTPLLYCVVLCYVIIIIVCYTILYHNILYYMSYILLYWDRRGVRRALVVLALLLFLLLAFLLLASADRRLRIPISRFYDIICSYTFYIFLCIAIRVCCWGATIIALLIILASADGGIIRSLRPLVIIVLYLKPLLADDGTITKELVSVAFVKLCIMCYTTGCDTIRYRICAALRCAALNWAGLGWAGLG